MKKIFFVSAIMSAFLSFPGKGICQVANTTPAGNANIHLYDVTYNKLRSVADSFQLKQVAQDKTNMLVTQLHLSAEQVPMVEKVNFDYMVQLNTLYNTATSTTMASPEKTKGLKDDFTKALINVLTDSQVVEFRKIYSDN